MSDKSTKALIILDGWGTREEADHNAIAVAKTPVWDSLVKRFPHSEIETSGSAVGLPDGQMGNSEVGHMNIGAGRIVFQNFTRVNNAIADGSFQKNEALCDVVDGVKERKGALHVLGLFSEGGVHSHVDHIEAMCRMAADRGLDRIFVHAFLDGRDTPPRLALETIRNFEEKVCDSTNARVVSVVGRYFAMDRDNRWSRIEQAYRLITEGKGQFQSDSATKAVEAAYERDENDEFVKATAIRESGDENIGIEPDDGVVFMNFRPDRARQLTKALIDKKFEHFDRPFVLPAERLVTLTEYSAELPAKVAFPPVSLKNSLGEVIANKGMHQLRIAETEKYAHVTFFFNGGREAVFEGEERIMVPSPDVASYDLQPEMSAPELTEKLVDAIRSKRFDLVVCNFANGDMVGHTGVFDAVVKAVEAVDDCLGKLTEALLEADGECLITADHGNAEKMYDDGTGQIHTAHTTGTVPLIYVSGKAEGMTLADGGLRDLAPTLLALYPLEQPEEMTGRNLLQPAS
ncbi:MAG: 2,3-bisphosphoglycerate-independent phosphoglycerate mutase [Oleiphilaceae bacterium]|nr:2,3-bisphosphoglycerate-independent phosphoglycerate mutase [Oleiphilaceae bacterium]